MAYKDFSSYNEAAEGVRPNARIQLIQRILNAASLISNLVSGVPLRWAQNYKAFQVLKYTAGQDPSDVTTQAAISAVDSTLHEAESQLRASNDDMTTLTSELEALPIRGSVQWDSNFPPLPEGKDGYAFRFTGNSTKGAWFIWEKTPGLGIEGYRFHLYKGSLSGLSARWYDIASSELPFSVTSEYRIGTPVYYRVYVLPINEPDMTGPVTLMIALGNTNGTYISTSVSNGPSSNEGQMKIPTSEYNDDEQHTYNADSSSLIANTNGLRTMQVLGFATSSDYLGLPDPSSVINILDGMVS